MEKSILVNSRSFLGFWELPRVICIWGIKQMMTWSDDKKYISFLKKL